MQSESQRLRSELGHPIIDCDGHIHEYLPAILPHFREQLGPRLFEQYSKRSTPFGDMVKAPGTRTRLPQSGWWGTPSKNTRDLATGVLPKLLHERLDEFGIDFTVLYPTQILGIAGIDDEEFRIPICRGYNEYLAETYLPFADRMTPVGLIPMHTPAEALAELQHCHELGLKVIGFPEGVLREIPEPGESSPWLLPGQAHWFDSFAMDSEYDYDPVWAKLGELNFAATFHGGIGDMMPFVFTSPSSFVYNHIGYFAERMQKVCKQLFFGGVTTRFPDLNIVFLECGIGWAATLLSDILEHWEKRSIDALKANLDPKLVDFDLLEGLMREYGSDFIRNMPPEQLRSSLSDMSGLGGDPVDFDEFRAVQITKKSDIHDRFVPRFYFGCEADDPTIAFAFSKANAFGAKLQPVLSSDISHWDVDDMSAVLTNAHKLVRKEILDADQFREFMCGNALRLFSDSNPQFFDGTAVESFARKELSLK